MANTCTVCRHKARAAIDRALVAAEPHRRIAKRHGLSPEAVNRHKASHVPEALSVAQGVKLEAHGASLLEQVNELKIDARRIGMRAEEEGDLRTALAGIRELTRLVELMAKVSGELSETTVVNLVSAPEWMGLRGRILAALDRFPEAKAAVVGALDG